MGVAALFTTAVVASSPQTVLNGGIPTTYAQTGVPGVPMSFLLIMVVIGILAVGYVAMAQHVKHGAPFYGQLVHGFNPTAGLMAAGVAFVGYNALQTSLYPLLGTTLAAMVGGTWWVWALVAWLIVLFVGRYPGAVNARFLGVLLALEIVVILLFIAAGFAHPADGAITGAVFAPSSLLVAGAAASVLVFATAAFAGVESELAYAEEATSHRALACAFVVAMLSCGLLYCLASWAYGTAIGFGDLQAAAIRAENQPLQILGATFGPGITDLATFLLVTSVLAAMTSFHATVARYVFALAREHVLPARWAAVSRGPRGGAPVGGSVVQAVVAVLVVAGFLVSGADPMAVMFTWNSTIGAFSILLLLTASSWAALAFFGNGKGGAESIWVRQIFPFAGGILGVLAVVFMASSLGALLGTAPGSARPWLVGAPIGVFALIGLAVGLWLRHTRPGVYRQIGYGVPDPQTVLDQDLEDVEV
jgi:amino acid transporter